MNLKKITIIGNAGVGKTQLSRRLKDIYNLPLTHMDSIQFLPRMKIRPHSESIQILNKILDQDSWIIEGFGPLDILENRFEKSDRIIFIDLPLWQNYFWCTKRQIQSLWTRREELPEGCSDLSWSQTIKLFKTVHNIHYKMRPELIRILNREKFKSKLIWIRSSKELNQLKI